MNRTARVLDRNDRDLCLGGEEAGCDRVRARMMDLPPDLCVVCQTGRYSRTAHKHRSPVVPCICLINNSDSKNDFSQIISLDRPATINVKV